MNDKTTITCPRCEREIDLADAEEGAPPTVLLAALRAGQTDADRVTAEELAEVAERTSGHGALAGDGLLLKKFAAEVTALRAERADVLARAMVAHEVPIGEAPDYISTALRVAVEAEQEEAQRMAAIAQEAHARVLAQAIEQRDAARAGLDGLEQCCEQRYKAEEERDTLIKKLDEWQAACDRMRLAEQDERAKLEALRSDLEALRRKARAVCDLLDYGDEDVAADLGEDVAVALVALREEAGEP